jgi:hypothetical protein
VPALAPPALAQPESRPAEGRRLVEQAVVDGALSAEGPETLVRTDVPQSDGSVRLYAAWTAGGRPLADHIDRVALASGMDACSWMAILQRHARTTHRGRIEVRAYPLRQVLHDVEHGHRGSEQLRANLARLLADDAARAGRRPLPSPGIPAWVGVGPLLWRRYLHDGPVVERRWLTR